MTLPCGCLFSDAWRCADARSLALMTCHCHCHRSEDDPIRAAITRAQAEIAVAVRAESEHLLNGEQTSPPTGLLTFVGMDLAPGPDATVFYCVRCRTQVEGDVAAHVCTRPPIRLI